MNEELKEKLAEPQIWKRGFIMLLFAIIYAIAEIVIAGVAIIQFGFALLTGSPNEDLRRFGQQLSTYVYHIFRFQTFNSEYRPFPFDEWDNLPAKSSPENERVSQD